MRPETKPRTEKKRGETTPVQTTAQGSHPRKTPTLVKPKQGAAHTDSEAEKNALFEEVCGLRVKLGVARAYLKGFEHGFTEALRGLTPAEQVLVLSVVTKAERQALSYAEKPPSVFSSMVPKMSEVLS